MTFIERVDALIARMGEGPYPSIADTMARYGESQHVARAALRKLRGLEVPEKAPSGSKPEAKAYYQIDDDGTYVFRWVTSRRKSKEVRIPGPAWEQMVRDYTDKAVGGGGKTMQEVAVPNGLARHDFDRCRTIYGLTKRHEPFTVEKMGRTPTEDLLDDQLALRRAALVRAFEREDLAQIRSAAKKWLALEAKVLDPFRELLGEVVGHVPPKPEEEPVGSPGSTRYILIYQGSDLHLGLYSDPAFAVDGERYDRAEAVRRYRSGLDRAVEHGLAAYGRPEYVTILVGGDICHVDNIHGATSSMKHHQDLDGVPDTLPRDVARLYLDAVDGLLAQGLPVYLTCVPGNHDEMLSRAAFAVLWAAYRNNPRVTFGNEVSSHAIWQYGANAIVAHHGHGEATAKELASTLSTWLQRTGRTALHRYAITGNLHHLSVEEDHGMIVVQQPSPAASDRYHTTNGYAVARPATVGVYISPTEGLLGIRYLGF